MGEVDWRLLLPPPDGDAFERMVLVGGSAGLAEQLVSAGVARAVVDSTGPGTADLVVVLRDGHLSTSVTDAVSMLRPNGVVYYEVDRTKARSGRRGPRRIARRFRAAGATVIGCYWIRPTLEVRRSILPLDSPGALRWFQKSELPRETVAERGKAAIFGVLTHLGPAAPALVVRRFGVVARRGVPSHETAAGILLHPALPARIAGPGARAILLPRTSPEVVGKVVVLPFPHKARQPSAVLKVGSGADGEEGLRLEQRNLATLRSMLDVELRESIPEPRGMIRDGDFSISVEGYLPGISLSRLDRRLGASATRSIKHFRLVADWITRFGVQTQSKDDRWTRDHHRAYVETPLEAYTAAFSVTGGEARFLERVVDRSVSLVGTRLPIVWRHGDFDADNIAVAGDTLSIFDWVESGEGLPLLDLLHFSRLWYRGVKKIDARSEGVRDSAEDFRKLYCGASAGDPIAAIVEGAMRRYLARLGIGAGYLPVALAVYGALHAGWAAGLERADKREEYVGQWRDFAAMTAAHEAALLDGERRPVPEAARTGVPAVSRG